MTQNGRTPILILLAAPEMALPRSQSRMMSELPWLTRWAPPGQKMPAH